MLYDAAVMLQIQSCNYGRYSKYRAIHACATERSILLVRSSPYVIMFGYNAVLWGGAKMPTELNTGMLFWRRNGITCRARICITYAEKAREQDNETARARARVSASESEGESPRRHNAIS